MSSPLQLGFQDSASFVMKEFHQFHDYAMVFVMFMTVLMLYALGLLVVKAPPFQKFTEKQQMELWWTMSPSFILIALAIPSMKLLYFMDEGTKPKVTVKTMGHQWYWTYEMWDKKRMEMDSYMIHLEDLQQEGNPRLLEVDNRLTLPTKTDMRVITSSTDVMHAWCVPSLGLKMDAVPGRLKQMFVKIKRPGVFYGQCSEMCGANHSFMPMVVEATKKETFSSWCQTLAKD